MREAARQHPPFRSLDAERAVHEIVRQRYSTTVHDCDQLTIECTPRIEIALGAEVREHRQALGYQLLKIEAETEITKLRIDKLAELRDRWLEFFTECGFTADPDKDWRPRFAVLLAEYPKDVHAVLTAMLEERRGEAERLLSMVDAVVNAQHTANVYDLVVGSETVLRKTLDLMGVKVPEISDSPFD